MSSYLDAAFVTTQQRVCFFLLGPTFTTAVYGTNLEVRNIDRFLRRRYKTSTY